MQLNALSYRKFIQSTQEKPIIATTKQELYEAMQQKKMQYYRYVSQHSEHLKDNIESQINTLRIGLTPTMGALHDGHKSLIQENTQNNHIAVVSIFVNPTQFAPNEDLAKYPRTFTHDIELCQELGTDIVFAPTPEIMYEESDEITLNPPKKMGYILEGYYRPTHFAGVLQVVLKLFNLIMPTHAYFGKKDAQQLLIIQKMVQHLCLPIQIIGMPIIRDNDMLALSSRNVYLDSAQRQQALAIPRAILHIESLIKEKNIKDTQYLKNEAKEILKGLEIDYMDFYSPSLELVTEAKDCIFLLAVRVGNVRLLDNLWC